MNAGRIKWFNCFDNFGYIVLFDGTEVYFHGTGLREVSFASSLNPGADVMFDLIHTRTGPEAHKIEPIG